jgi:serine/threonine protein kinase
VASFGADYRLAGRPHAETDAGLTMSRDMEDVARALPDYELRGELGRGEYGIVWGGRHRQLGREVAVKQLADGVTSTTEYRARFRREARILAHVDHPHVVRVYDYREQDDLRLLVMELLPGARSATVAARGSRSRARSRRRSPRRRASSASMSRGSSTGT